MTEHSVATREDWLQARMALLAEEKEFTRVRDALSAKRPYRDALPLEKVFSMMREEAPHALDWLCLDALMESRSVSESRLPA